MIDFIDFSTGQYRGSAPYRWNPDPVHTIIERPLATIRLDPGESVDFNFGTLIPSGGRAEPGTYSTEISLLIQHFKPGISPGYLLPETLSVKILPSTPGNRPPLEAAIIKSSEDAIRHIKKPYNDRVNEIIECDPLTCDYEGMGQDLFSFVREGAELTDKLRMDAVPFALTSNPVPTNSLELLVSAKDIAEHFIDFFYLVSGLLNESTGSAVEDVEIEGIESSFQINPQFRFGEIIIVADLAGFLSPEILSEMMGAEFFNTTGLFGLDHAFGILELASVFETPTNHILTLRLAQVEVSVPEPSLAIPALLFGLAALLLRPGITAKPRISRE